jgi:hypothetical protein
MTELSNWLQQATRRLAKDSIAQVQTEIQDHYESAREAAIAAGAANDEADRQAILSLGDPKTANRQYRQVLLTSTEARMLRDVNWEARAFCSRPWLKWLLLLLPLPIYAAAAFLLVDGRTDFARDLAVFGVTMSLLVAGPLLPIFTPSRSRIFRLVKWLGLAAAVILLFGPQLLQWSWLLLSCVFPAAWTEWTRASIRRKLPVTAWPKHLYL